MMFRDVSYSKPSDVVKRTLVNKRLGEETMGFLVLTYPIGQDSERFPSHSESASNIDKQNRSLEQKESMQR